MDFNRVQGGGNILRKFPSFKYYIYKKKTEILPEVKDVKLEEQTQIISEFKVVNLQEKKLK